MSASPLTMVQLRCLIGVVDSGSFAQAARQLGLSASGVSKTIARMEEARGMRLLNRSTHSLSLTPEGEVLIELAREAVRSMESVDAAMTAGARLGARGRVRVGTTASFMRAWLVPLLPAFHEQHPDIILDLRASDDMVDLAQDGVDLVLRGGRIDGIPGHLRRPLLRFNWVTCAAPSYLAGRSPPETPHDLASHDLIGFRNQRTGTVVPWSFTSPNQARDELRWTPEPALIIDDANAVAAAAVAGVGVAWAPDWLIAADLRAGRLQPLLAAWTCGPKDISIIRRKHSQSPARVEKVIAFLKSHANVLAAIGV